jgi:formylglycine-generating enzyme required for sulfatase activity
MAVTDVSETMLDDAAALSGTNLGGGAWSGSQPAANVTWYEAAAFVNWLNTSQGYTAAYNLTYSGNTPIGITLWTGANIWTLGGSDPFRNANAHYFLPSENEWYKAAYYSPGGVYYQYADGSNTAPTAVASGTAAGTAVYNGVASQPAAVDQSGGLSPYGTQGQTGNVWQWAETDYSDPTNSSDGGRVIRGGYWFGDPSNVASSGRYYFELPTVTGFPIGFRVASVPEPNSLMLMGAGIIGAALMRRKPFHL